MIGGWTKVWLKARWVDVIEEFENGAGHRETPNSLQGEPMGLTARKDLILRARGKLLGVSLGATTQSSETKVLL